MDELTGIALGHVNRLGRQAVSYAQEIDRANGEIDKANAIIADKNQIIADLQARIAELELRLALKTAHAAGMKAYRDDLRAAHPNSPRLAPSGKRYKDGTPKPVAALAYDREFDRILRDARISNPEQYRD
jgi:hypothetical protein